MLNNMTINGNMHTEPTVQPTEIYKDCRLTKSFLPKGLRHIAYSAYSKYPW